MNRHSPLCRAVRAVHRTSLLLKVVVTVVISGVAACKLMYDACGRGALGWLAIEPVVCVLLIPVLFIGCVASPDRTSRTVLGASGFGAAQIGAIIGVSIYTGDPISSLAALPMSWFIWAVNFWGLLAFLAMIASAVAGSFGGNWLLRRTHIQAGICSSCGYDLTNLSSARCPECGQLVESITPRDNECRSDSHRQQHHDWPS